MQNKSLGLGSEIPATIQREGKPNQELHGASLLHGQGACVSFFSHYWLLSLQPPASLDRILWC